MKLNDVTEAYAIHGFQESEKEEKFFLSFLISFVLKPIETDYLLENFFSELKFYEMKSHDDRHYKSVS